ncbi:MAG: aspartate--tRNA(Asn) ligase, partial [Acidimicrobiia bacterium]
MIKDIRKAVGSEAKVQGWVKTIRDQKKMQFLIVRDHTGVVQATVERSAAKASINELIAGLTRESAISVIGIVVENPIVKTGGVEILIRELIVESRADGLIPIDPDGPVEPNSEVRLNWRFLDLRRPEIALIFQVQTAFEHAMREYWIKEGFLEIHSPKLMGSPSEGGAEVFPFEYFGRTAYLAQSPQFYKQMAMAAGFDRVFEIGPVFRADPSFTARHATEFTGLDIEMSWIDSHEDVMAFEERWLAYSLEQVKQEYGDSIRETFGIEVSVPAVPFPRVPMQEAREIIAGKGHVIPLERGDLDPPGERLIAEYAMERFGHEFVFVTDYPVDVRPFYHMRYVDTPHVTKSFDL